MPASRPVVLRFVLAVVVIAGYDVWHSGRQSPARRAAPPGTTRRLDVWLPTGAPDTRVRIKGRHDVGERIRGQTESVLTGPNASRP
jgi:hypothetical protein